MWRMEPLPGDIVLARKIVTQEDQHDLFGKNIKGGFRPDYEEHVQSMAGEIIFRRRFGLPQPVRESYEKSDAILGNFRIDVKTVIQKAPGGQPPLHYQNNIAEKQMGTINTLVVFLRYIAPGNVFWMCGWASKARIRELGRLRVKNDILDNGNPCKEPMFEIMNANLHHMGILWYFCNNWKPPGGLIEWDTKNSLTLS